MKKTSRRTGGSRKPSRKPLSRRRGPLPFEHALAAFTDLAKHAGLRWYVFGAQAVNLHGFPRATADLDITVELGRESVGRRKIPMISLENLVVTKVIAGRPRDTEDVRELLAIHDRTVDYERISARLHTVAQALDQSDLRPRLRSLRPKRQARKKTS